jgi:proline iminopeptidase
VERFVPTDDGGNLWVDITGSGAPIVLCHGGPGLWDYLDPVARLLDDAHSVVRWDQRGCGRSANMWPHTVARYVADLEAIRTAFGWATWVVAGHSWGGMLALNYALAHPQRVQAVMCLNSMGPGRAWREPAHREAERRAGPERAQLLRDLLARPRTWEEELRARHLRWASDFADYERGLELGAAMDSPFEVNLEANRAIADEVGEWDEFHLTAGCAAVRVPVLFLHGSEDPRPEWANDPLIRDLPDVHVEVLQGVGHLPWLEAPADVRQVLRTFVAQAEGR